MRHAATAFLFALLATAAFGFSRPALADGKGPVLLVLPGPESERPYVFQLKGDGGELLCTSEGFKKAKKAEKGARAAVKAGKALKNYIFQRVDDAKGEHHFWEVRESKKHKAVLCRSGPVEELAKAEHSAAMATKAFAQATVAVK